ncbi:MAG: ABC transporter ATP-binding protein [Bacteriovoracaceae bacterium]
MKAIVLKNLTKKFLDVTAVDDLSLKVGYGEVVALLGSNGAGKTTTLNMITGFLTPNFGEVLINEKWNHKNHYREIKNEVGYLTGSMQLYDKFSIKECLLFLADLRSLEKDFVSKRMEELVQLFQMESYLKKKFSELSSGQKQRALIAATILHDPRILILDEITANLDVPSARLIMDFLKLEKERGKAILFSTHILSEAEYLSDQIAIIHNGKVMEKTTSSEFKQKFGVTNLTDAFCDAIESFNKVKKVD